MCIRDRVTQRDNEAAIYLQYIELVASQIAERRIAGAKIVDREADPESPYLANAFADHLGVIDQHRFGDLYCEPFGLDAALGDDGVDSFDDVGFEKLLARHVDADREAVDSCVRPGPNLFARGS